jgi:hypothetical protein
LDAETIKQIIALASLFVGVIGLWHKLVILPIKEELKLNATSIRTLEIDSAKLDTTLTALTNAIDRLTDRLDRE